MCLPRLHERVLALLAVAAVFAVAFSLFVRPAYLNWGATPEERERALPGDDIVAGPATQETRAITINAAAEAVWPWLTQIGQDRAGFYSFDLLENAVGCEMPAIHRLDPDLQRWRLGDKLWMYPPRKAGGAGFATLRVHEPARALGFGTRMVGTSLEAPENGSWSWVVEPVSARTTRLLIRGRGTAARSLGAKLFDVVVFEPMHFAMERRMMINVRALAQGGSRRALVDHLHVGLWLATSAIGLAAAIMVFARRAWLGPLGVFAAAGAVFQLLTLAQPPVIVGVVLVAMTAALLWRASPQTPS